MATLILEDGTKKEVVPNNGKTFSLQEYYDILDCRMVQVINLANGKTMWLDEEGKFKEHMRNADATVLLHQAGGAMNDYIAGHALICEPNECN